MFKIINYFFQSLLIYLFFLVAIILGIKMSRRIFGSLFSFVGPFFKSKKILNNNLKIYSQTISEDKIKEISNNMWKNYGMTFIEYMFLKYFKKQSSHISITGENNLKILKKVNQ
tara:strand:- start:1350 stop:1691 length:342 start_codon:yes stop_codon:yes gene_type:complete